MLLLYTILSSLIYWIIFPYASLRAVTGSVLWRNRLGWTSGGMKTDMWLHAASVGEVQILSHLIDYLQKKSKLTLHVTVVTKAGYQTALKQFAGKAHVSYLPMDCPFSMKRKFDSLQPAMIVIAETEIWPRLIVTAKKRDIPIVMVNARMTERGFGRYKLIKNAISLLLTGYNHFFLKTKEDADCYYEFGVEKARTTIAGDMKFDAPLTERSDGRVAELRSRLTLASDEFILIAGSTRPGEEALLLALLAKCRDTKLNLRLVLAPRHIERTDEIHQLCRTRNINTCAYDIKPQTDEVVIVEKIGVLKELYLAADLAFVGGTLVSIGGHNLLEPVWAGVPVVYGPSLFNVVDAAKYISENNYGTEIVAIDDMFEVISEMSMKRRSFARKERTDSKESATALAGEYILKALAND